LHIGNFRGSVIGDVLARIYRMLGATVNVRYYVNDLGRQIAPAVIGYSLLTKEGIQPDCKIDLWIGKIYATMNTLLDIQELKKELRTCLNGLIVEKETMYELTSEEKENYHSLLSEIDLDENRKEKLKSTINKLYNVQNSLFEKIPDLYSTLRALVYKEVDDLSTQTIFYVEEYLRGKNKEVINKFRELTEQSLSGHIETLHSFNIEHDDFDRESDVAWSGEVDQILQKLEEKGWLRHDGKARLLKNDEIATSLRFKEKYGLKHKLSDLILVNSEGIPLYPCRDIAYHLHKLEKFNASKCINVIGKQQQALQLGVKLALYALNKCKIADKITHFDYEYVTLVGRKMAGRELEYVTPDELIGLARKEVLELLKDKNYSEDEKEEIARKVATSSVKYSILKIDPQKAVIFDVKKAVDLNENTGPFLQYSFTRALNIISKGKELSIPVDDILDSYQKYSMVINKKEEWQLVKIMEELPSIYERAIEMQRPDTIANFAFEFCKFFNKFYDNCPVITEENEEIRISRVLLVKASIKCFESLFMVMGLDKLEKM
ncbi:MAG: arginine--tRNA ligase domain-containing protein, partial [Candidatus Heimdallarchaeaceae archaeon]